MVTEHHRTLQEQSESIHHDIQAHLTGIHGEHKGKRQPYWETSPCHGTFPCDYLDRLSKEREQLAATIQRQHSEDYRNGFAHGRDVGMATSETKYAGVLQCCITMLARLDLEASYNWGEFPGRAYREDLRRIIEAATGSPRPSPYIDHPTPSDKGH